MQSGLYVVGTPIGNLGDMSPRAVEVLNSADLIACEDTRVFGKLASRFNIKTKRIIMHEHNEREISNQIADMIAGRMTPDGRPVLEGTIDGAAVAVVSDSGMPAIADPGFRVIRECRARKLPVFAVPGPTAAATAVAISGFATDRFTFCNFLPSTPGARLNRLRKDNHIRHTIVYYESPARIMDTIADLARIMPERKIAVIREITKLYEQAIIGYPAELANIEPPRGEIAIVIEGAEDAGPTDDEISEIVREIAAQGHGTKDAAELISQHARISKSEAYERVLRLK
jgi:16S rRNA (cytidine1402-2'-O)-methyltransferase